MGTNSCNVRVLTVWGDSADEAVPGGAQQYRIWRPVLVLPRQGARPNQGEHSSNSYFPNGPFTPNESGVKTKKIKEQAKKIKE